MLTKRAQILFDQNMWNQLIKLAKKQQTSVSEIIRKTVEKQIEDEEVFEKRYQAIESTMKNRLKSRKKINYRELINYGRKY